MWENGPDIQRLTPEQEKQLRDGFDWETSWVDPADTRWVTTAELKQSWWFKWLDQKLWGDTSTWNAEWWPQTPPNVWPKVSSWSFDFWWQWQKWPEWNPQVEAKKPWTYDHALWKILKAQKSWIPMTPDQYIQLVQQWSWKIVTNEQAQSIIDWINNRDNMKRMSAKKLMTDHFSGRN